jgi:peptidyl-prolyl cis-trans isomerase C
MAQMQIKLNHRFIFMIVLLLIVGVYGVNLTKPALAQKYQQIVVATVDGAEIQLDEILDLIEQLPPEYQNEPLTNYYDQMVDRVINVRLAAKAAEKSALSDDPEVIEDMRVAAQKVLADYWLRSEIAKSVTKEAIDKAYDAYVSDTASREEVKASHILVADEQTAISAIQKLEEGADFAELAREISTGPSGPNGGDLGYFGRGAMVPVFEQAAFALDVGSFTSAPVQSQFGWHVIKLLDKRIAEAPSIEEMSPQLEQNITNLSFARLVETLRADAKIQKKSLSDIEEEWKESQESMESSTQ